MMLLEAQEKKHVATPLRLIRIRSPSVAGFVVRKWPWPWVFTPGAQLSRFLFLFLFPLRKKLSLLLFPFYCRSHSASWVFKWTNFRWTMVKLAEESGTAATKGNWSLFHADFSATPDIRGWMLRIFFNSNLPTQLAFSAFNFFFFSLAGIFKRENIFFD